MKVKDILFSGSGMTVAFDDDSTVHLLYKVRDGVLDLDGPVSTAQRSAISDFMTNKISDYARQIDPRLNMSRLNHVTLTADATVVGAHAVVFCDATDGDITVNLGDPALSDGRAINFLRKDNTGNTVIIDGFTKNLSDFNLHSYQTIQAYSNGVDWYPLHISWFD